MRKQTTHCQKSLLLGSRLDPGINNKVLETAANLFKKSPVNEASDGARALRFVHLMTPRAEDIVNGVRYLGLGVEDEKLFAPYYWVLSAICYIVFEVIKEVA